MSGACQVTSRIKGDRLRLARVFWHGARLAHLAQARVGLQRLDHRGEVFEAQNAFKLKAGAVFGGPDDMRLDPADTRQADDHPLASRQWAGLVYHETMRRNVRNGHSQIAELLVFGDDWIFHRVPRRTPQIGYCKLCAACHN